MSHTAQGADRPDPPTAARCAWRGNGPNSCLAEAQELPKLDAVILDRAPRPLIAWKQVRWHAYLPDNMDNDRARQLMHMTGKATLQGERLEQQAESETSRASLVRQELELIGQKRPVLSQLIMRPIAASSSGTIRRREWTCSVPRGPRTRSLTSTWALVSKSTDTGQCRHTLNAYLLLVSSARAPYAVG
jgi:hypothetical protein